MTYDVIKDVDHNMYLGDFLHIMKQYNIEYEVLDIQGKKRNSSTLRFIARNKSALDEFTGLFPK
jgi:hypothetical protein